MAVDGMHKAYRGLCIRVYRSRTVQERHRMSQLLDEVLDEVWAIVESHGLVSKAIKGIGMATRREVIYANAHIPAQRKQDRCGASPQVSRHTLHGVVGAMGWSLINRLAPSDHAGGNMRNFLQTLPAHVAYNIQFGRHCNVTPLADRASLMMMVAFGEADWDSHVLWALVVGTCFIHNATALEHLLANWATCPKTCAGRAEALRIALATLGNQKSPLSHGLLTGTLGMLHVKKGGVVMSQIAKWVLGHEELDHFQHCSVSIANCPAQAARELQKWFGLPQFRADVCTRLLGLWFPVNFMASTNVGFGAVQCLNALGGDIMDVHYGLVNDPILKTLLEDLAMLGLPWTLQCTEHMLCELRKVCNNNMPKRYVERPGFQLLFAHAKPILYRLSKHCQSLALLVGVNNANTRNPSNYGTSFPGSSDKFRAVAGDNRWAGCSNNRGNCVVCVSDIHPAKRRNIFATSPDVEGTAQAAKAAVAAIMPAALFVSTTQVTMEQTSIDVISMASVNTAVPWNVFVHLQELVAKVTQERDVAFARVEQLQTIYHMLKSEHCGGVHLPIKPLIPPGVLYEGDPLLIR